MLALLNASRSKKYVRLIASDTRPVERRLRLNILGNYHPRFAAINLSLAYQLRRLTLLDSVIRSLAKRENSLIRMKHWLESLDKFGLLIGMLLRYQNLDSLCKHILRGWSYSSVQAGFSGSLSKTSCPKAARHDAGDFQVADKRSIWQTGVFTLRQALSEM